MLMLQHTADTASDITDKTALITVQVAIPVNENSWIAPSRLADLVVTSEVTLMCERAPPVKLSAMAELNAKKEELQSNQSGP